MFDIPVHIKCAVGERQLIEHEFNRRRLEDLPDAFFLPASEEKIDGEFGVIDTGKEMYELENSFTILSFI